LTSRNTDVNSEERLVRYRSISSAGLYPLTKVYQGQVTQPTINGNHQALNLKYTRSSNTFMNIVVGTIDLFLGRKR